MIWLALLLLACVTMAPLAFVLRRGGAARGRRDADLALHRAQLVELDRDLAESRIGAAEHKEARLEVQRRLLAADAAPDVAPAGSAPAATAGHGGTVAILVLIPLAALVLYLVGGSPNMPAAPLAERIARADAQQKQEAALVGELRSKLAALDPHSPQAHQGYILLGNLEISRGNFAAAAAAWRIALQTGFDPLVAAEAAEAATQAEGQVSPASADLFRRALAAAPQDAPWRPMVEQRLAQAKKG
jgi:cytochrome c-type biogenesis protein CcmH